MASVSLQSQVRLSSDFGGWATSLLFEEYQTINLDKIPPYRRDPQLTIQVDQTEDNVDGNLISGALKPTSGRSDAI